VRMPTLAARKPAAEPAEDAQEQPDQD
jgi:hypothetical protein